MSIDDQLDILTIKIFSFFTYNKLIIYLLLIIFNKLIIKSFVL